MFIILHVAKTLSAVNYVAFGISVFVVYSGRVEIRKYDWLKGRTVLWSISYYIGWL